MNLINLKKFAVIQLAVVMLIFALPVSVGLFSTGIMKIQTALACDAVLNDPTNHGANTDCSAGQTCNAAGSCVAQTGTPNPNNQNTPAGNGGCGTGLENVNGICLPQNNFKGLAGTKNLTDLITTVVSWALFLVGLIALIYIIVGGFWYVTAGGNEEQSEKGRTAITNAVIGIIIVILSYAIVAIVSSTLTAPVPTDKPFQSTTPAANSTTN